MYSVRAMNLDSRMNNELSKLIHSLDNVQDRFGDVAIKKVDYYVNEMIRFQ